VVEALFRNYLPEGSRESTELVVLFSLANFTAIEAEAERALTDADTDQDGLVDEAEFIRWASKHPMLTQLLTLSRTLFGP
jgi:Ca2+-binding EF-hand superfamily protein